jgi:hypothetical protein
MLRTKFSGSDPEKQSNALRLALPIPTTVDRSTARIRIITGLRTTSPGSDSKSPTGRHRTVINNILHLIAGRRMMGRIPMILIATRIRTRIGMILGLQVKLTNRQIMVATRRTVIRIILSLIATCIRTRIGMMLGLQVKCPAANRQTMVGASKTLKHRFRSSGLKFHQDHRPCRDARMLDRHTLILSNRSSIV